MHFWPWGLTRTRGSLSLPMPGCLPGNNANLQVTEWQPRARRYTIEQHRLQPKPRM
jgi:hypothetical protein